MAKTLGQMIDNLKMLRDFRLEKQREVDSIQAQERALEGEVLSALTEAGLDSGRGDVATASVSLTVVPTVADWPSFYEYIKQNDAFDLLERRPASGACRARWDDKLSIPGVEQMNRVSLSLRKRGEK
jgi:hypothetical protein